MTSSIKDPTSTDAPLLPCPFCGALPYEHPQTIGYAADMRAAVWCENCGAMGPALVGSSVAKEFWNTRSMEAKPDPEGDGVREALRDLIDAIERDPRPKSVRLSACISNAHDSLTSEPTRTELVEAVVAAARQMPRATPAAGGSGTIHTFEIEAGVVWTLDIALKKLDALLSRKQSGGGS